ncbi:hypothetical protein [Flagellimonas zhangzhouensis]|uniref:Fibronectin type-III domain-containing protein n=1 Tax=Flagellimonas zhangzhouensis TaxID=1073328 RepID=A0A1H2QSM3_9FLAO|nr:hypothetical protein [Allomuricauda zhangzhouensis]SDQ55968.1 hypothetical protein SAMN05216294_1681 [Allomuricauda zhangzhouensis]SDW09634.1 hypothetical protein SAMN04487892_0333 [Allomuricauda zhangzhouensis]
MKIASKYIVPLVLLTLFSCGGSGDDPTPEPEPEVPVPLAATLVFPDNNEECTEGVIVSDTESQVTFQWAASENTDDYTLTIQNLETGVETSSSTSNTELQVTLNRGTAYSWIVVSSADGTNETATSETWRFYNAGAAIENYAPFPAYDPYPEMGIEVVSGNISLQWEGSDLDGDSLSYSVYLDTANPPTTLLGGTASTNIDATLEADTIYYWQVISTDSAGNSSTSEIFEFRTSS